MAGDNLNKVSGMIRQALQAIPKDILAEAVIFGSSAIVLNGVDLKREVDDLDIFVSDATYSRLAALASKTEEKAPNVVALKLGPPNIEILKEFPGVDHAAVLRNAAPRESSGGMLVASLEDLMRWKSAQNREKDRNDIAIIEACLKQVS